MFKMILVDDERMERTYMKKCIDWQSLNIQVCGEADNGEEALEVCSKIKPDIILTDIKMPVMDGLEFSVRVKDILPEVKIIFISGHEDFEYAKTVANLNAFGYILKPFRIQDVIDVVKKVVNICDEDFKKDVERTRLLSILQENISVLKESFIREFLDGTKQIENIWGRVEYLDIQFKKGLYGVILFEIDDIGQLYTNLKEEDRQIFSINLLQMVRHTIKQYSYGEVIKISDAQYVALLSGEPNVEDFDESMFQVAEKAKEKAETQGISITIGISTTGKSIEAIHKMYQQVQKAIEYKIYDHKGEIIYINDLPFATQKQSIDFNQFDKEFIEYLKAGNKEKINDLLDSTFDRLLVSHNVSTAYLQNLCISIISMSMRFLIEINCTFEEIFGERDMVWNKLMRFETISDIKQWMKNIFSYMVDNVNAKKKSKNQLIVEQVKEIINERYGEELTTKELSKKIFLSPNYIGAIFKNETGIGFLEYLTQVRMEEAKVLLQDINLKIYEVAEQVGYNNTPYFSTVFKDFMGFAPKEYRERIYDSDE